jgi:hypothetical protein
MAVTETRLLPKSLVDECRRALARLEFVRNVDRAHPVVLDSWRPHPVDCDVCTSHRRLDIALDNVLKAISNVSKVT